MITADNIHLLHDGVELNIALNGEEYMRRDGKASGAQLQVQKLASLTTPCCWFIITSMIMIVRTKRESE